MASVLHFRRDLATLPPVLRVPDISVRNFNSPNDVERWLALRDQAMADQIPCVRTWSDADFRTEMKSKPWWRTDHTWLAIAGDTQQLAGSVTLALRQSTSQTVPVIHWLLVDPAWRRHGIARLLISHLERAA